MSSLSPSISIIVPTLNEAENIEGIIAKILAGAGSLDLEIIVVDDGSRDETQAIVRRLGETKPVTLLARDRPKDGLVGAVLAGARASKAPVVLVIDADGSHPPEKIPELAMPVIQGERDMVIGSRYAPGGSTPGWSRKRRLMSRAASACAWPLTDVHDALSGFFAVRRELLAGIPSDAAGFKIALEILVRGGDTLRVGEVPIVFRDRELGQSKMGTNVILTYFRRLLALSGWRESQDGIGPAAAKTALVWIADFAVFALASALQASLFDASLFGFAAGATLNAWLKTAQLPTETGKSASFLWRLLFVSLLAFFLRGGVLATCTGAFALPRLIAIVPAIVIAWCVLFLGYALVIWPVREHYGSGVRWRVAAIGATAYLFALRVVFLYALPINPRLARLTSTGAGLTPGDRITIGLRHFATMVLGANRAGMNLPALLCWIVAAWAVFKTALRLTDKSSAFRALLLFAVLPAFMWTGSIFGPETLLVAAWAIVLWLLTFAFRMKVAGLIAAAVAVVLFFYSGWLPSAHLATGTHGIVRALLFVAWQPVLLTPIGLAAALCCLPGSRRDERSVGEFAGGMCVVLPIPSLMSAYIGGTLGICASAAIWLALLPFIASGMRRMDGPLARWWPPAIYGCTVLYGLYFSWLAFSA